MCKKLIAVLLLICLCFGPLFANSGLSNVLNLASDIADLTKASRMEKEYKDIIKSKQVITERIKTECVSFSLPEKVAFYETEKVKPFGPSMLNLIFGFGWGDKVAKDYIAQRAFIVTDATILGVGASIIAVGGLAWLVMIIPISIAGEISKSKTMNIDTANRFMGDLTKYALIGTGGCLAVSHLLSCILTYTWAASYNRTIREGLGLDKHLKLAMAPTLTSSGETGIVLSAKLSF